MNWQTLDRCNGPDCPRCGCRDCQILQEPKPGSWWGCGRARCRHCGTAFPFREATQQPPAASQLPPVVVQEPPPPTVPEIDAQPQDAPEAAPDRLRVTTDPSRCPQCGGSAPAKSTQGRTQYRKCRECGFKFKTQKAG